MCSFRTRCCATCANCGRRLKARIHGGTGMKVYAKVVLALLLPRSTALAKPVITAGGVVNAASYATSGLPNSGIAQGSIFIVFGTDLAGRDLVQANTYPLP